MYVNNIVPAPMTNATTSSVKEEIIKPDSPPLIPKSDADEIRKYKKLLDEDAITQEEYETKKKQILNL